MAERPSILLVYPSCFYYPQEMERIEIKPSLLWLGSYLSQYFRVTYADYELEIGRPNSPAQIERFTRRVRRHLESNDFDILAISCWTSLSYLATRSVARSCRELFPDKLVLVGGYHPSARPQEFVSPERLFDYVVCGEGEYTVRDIASAWPSLRRPAETRVIVGRPLSADDLVPYNWDLVRPYFESGLLHDIANLYLFASRGCPFRCSFCMEPLKNGSWRAYPPETAVDEFCRAAADMQAHAIGISDACFGMRPGWRRAFLTHLRDRKPSFWVVMETRPEYLSEADIELLADLKVEIQFGIESCSVEMLHLMRKSRQPARYLEQFRRVSKELTRCGVIHRANLIFNHPGETPATLDETFAYIDRLTHPDHAYLIWVPHAYMHFPGCEIDRRRDWFTERFGTRFECADWWQAEGDQYEASMRVIPSSQLDGSKSRLWEEMMVERLRALKQVLAPPALDFASRKYYFEWQHAS